MIISFLSQKGGVSKSTLTRATAVAFSKSDWRVHVADMDFLQQTTAKWSEARDAQGLGAVEVSVHRRIESALRSEALYDLLLVDGRPASDRDTIILAQKSDLVVLGTSTSIDDLRPQLNLAANLRDEGVENMLFIINKATSATEANRAIMTIEKSGFVVSHHPILNKTGYVSAQDTGLCITETRYKTLNQIAVETIQDIVNKAIN